MRNLARVALSIGPAALFAACGGSPSLIGAPGATSEVGDSLPYHETFHYTGSEQSFTVPAGVTQLTVVALGARGGGTEARAHGGRVYAVIPVTPGERLAVFVGGEGSRTSGGFNGGGNAGGSAYDCYCLGYGGGGASDIRQGGDKLRDRVLVVGGGGGGGGKGNDYSTHGGTGGKGGGSSGLAGEPGQRGAGGGGGGGGSGCFYCGTPGGGGGGGSSYVESSAIKFRTWSGWNSAKDSGLVVFSWN